jgi:PEP-CTERM motif
MKPSSRIWRAFERHIVCIALLMATSVHAQSNNDITRTDAKGGIQWSVSTTKIVEMYALTGPFYDTKQIGSLPISPSGQVKLFVQYVKHLTPIDVMVDGSGRIIGGSFADELTWSVSETSYLKNEYDGSFSLSNLHFDFADDGSAQIWATATGSRIDATDVLAWHIPANAVTHGPGELTLDQLVTSNETVALWGQALLIEPNPEDFIYTALEGVAKFKPDRTPKGGMGTLRVSVVPEPSAGLSMGLGLVGLGVVMRRRAKPCGDPASSQA